MSTMEVPERVLLFSMFLCLSTASGGKVLALLDSLQFHIVQTFLVKPVTWLALAVPWGKCAGHHSWHRVCRAVTRPLPGESGLQLPVILVPSVKGCGQKFSTLLEIER